MAREEFGDGSCIPWVPCELKRFHPDCFSELVITNFEVEEDKWPVFADWNWPRGWLRGMDKSLTLRA